MKLRWKFPSTDGGYVQGSHDSAQDIYRARAWENAVREIIQNSLDAVKEKDKPVEISMRQTKVPSSEIGAADLSRHLDMAAKGARRQNDVYGARLYEKALNLANKDEILALAIIDKNTTGLVDDKWNALVYHEGTSNKQGMDAAGGSFGIGKNAPYLVSDLKTVCYSTRYLKRGRQEHFIVRCKISAHEDPDKPKHMLQHIGFGTKSQIAAGCLVPPTYGKDISKDFRLKHDGSGIFILGFNPLDKGWVDKAKEAVACNFFAAIHEKKLQLQIQDTQITYETLDGIFESCASGERAYQYYRLIRDPKARTETVEGKIGRFILHLKVGQDDHPSRIAYVNRRGMLVTDAKRFRDNPFYTPIGSGWAKYVAVVRAADDRTDKQIRDMEPPTHSSIKFERILDPNERSKTHQNLLEIRKKIEGIIRSAVASSLDSTEAYLDELWEIMSTEDDAGEAGQDYGDGQYHTRTIVSKRPTRGKLVGHSGSKDKKKGKGKHRGDAVPVGHTDSSFQKVRVMKSGAKLRVAFTPARDAKTLSFMIRPAGEEPKSEQALVLSGAEAVLPAGTRVKVERDTVEVRPTGIERVVLDLTVGADLEYTGYEMIEYAEGGKK